MQKMIQFKGPFKNGQRLIVDPAVNTEYIHIGIQIPEREPVFIAEHQQDETSITPTTIIHDSWRAIDPSRPEVSINGKQLSVSPWGILEFDQMGDIEIDIQILKNLSPESIIDVISSTRDI